MYQGLKLLFAASAIAALAACGGGGSGGGGNTANNGFARPDAYVGTWANDCSTNGSNGSRNTIFTIGNNNGVLQINTTSQYFSQLNCAGQPVVTIVDSRTQSATYVSSVAASIPLTTGGPIVNLTVEKATSSSPAGVNTITVAAGSGIVLTNGLAFDGVTSNNPGKCFSLSAGNSTCVPNNLPSESGTGGLYAQGSDLYFFDISTTGVVTVALRLRKR